VAGDLTVEAFMEVVEEAFTGVVEAVSAGAAEVSAEADRACRPRRERVGDIHAE
jgi:hypothetical protein